MNRRDALTRVSLLLGGTILEWGPIFPIPISLSWMR